MYVGMRALCGCQRNNGERPHEISSWYMIFSPCQRSLRSVNDPLLVAARLMHTSSDAILPSCYYKEVNNYVSFGILYVQ